VIIAAVNTLLPMLVAATITAAPCVEAQAPASLSAAQDGRWSVFLSCADTFDRNGVVKGYVYNFAVEIVGGRLEGRFDESRPPAFVHFAGEVLPDGMLFIRVDGLSGAPEATLGKVPTGTPYHYTMRGTLDASRGKAERVELRPCTAELAKQ
jgi:hypothetical protein